MNQLASLPAGFQLERKRPELPRGFQLESSGVPANLYDSDRGGAIDSMVSSAIAMPVSGLAGIAGGLAGLVPGGETGTEKANRWLNATRDAITIDPPNEASRSVLESVGRVGEAATTVTRAAAAPVMGALSAAGAESGDRYRAYSDTVGRTIDEGIGQVAGDAVEASGGSPAQSAAAQTLPTAVGAIFGTFAGRRAMKPDVPAPRDIPVSETGPGGVPIQPTTPAQPTTVGRPTLDRVEIEPSSVDRALSVVEKIRKGKESKVADDVMPDRATLESAERLGIDLNPEHYSTNNAFIDVTRALKSRPGSKLEANERTALTQLAQKADELVEDMGGSTDRAAVSDEVITRMRNTIDDMETQADAAYTAVREAIPAATRIDVAGVREFLQGKLDELGGDQAQLTTAEKRLLKMVQRKEKPSGKIDETTGLPLNEDGTVTVFHHTSAQRAGDIRNTGQLRADAEPDVYVTTRQEADTGYGDTSVPIRVKPKDLMLDDEFPDGRKDFRMSVGRPGGSKSISIDDQTRDISPTYAALDRVRRDIGSGFNRRSGPFKDDDTGALKEMYGVLSETQQGVAEAFGIGDLYTAARELVAKRKGIEDSAVELFGRDLQNSLAPKIRTAAAALEKGDVAKLTKLIEALPPEARTRVAATLVGDIFGRGSRSGGGLSNGFAQAWQALNRTPAAKRELFKYLPEGSQKRFDDMGRVLSGIIKSNQKPLANPSGSAGPIMKAFEDLTGFQKIYAVGKQAAAAEGVGNIAGAPGVGAGSVLIGNFLARKRTPIIVAADEMLASPSFARAVNKAAQGDVAEANRIISESPQFKKWLKTMNETDREVIARSGFVAWLASNE